MYTKIDELMWSDEKFKNLSDDGKLLFFYVLTCPHRNMLGTYFLPVPYGSFDLNWTPQRFEKGLKELLENSLIKYSFDTNVLFIKNYLKFNPLENQNQVKGAINALLKIPVNGIDKDLQEIIKRLHKDYHKPLIELLDKRLSKQVTVSVSEEVSVSVSEEGLNQPISIPYEEIKDLFNSICTSLPHVKALTNSRKDKLKTRWGEMKDIDKFKQLFEIVQGSNFLKGGNKQNWKCTFDWLIENDKNYVKVLEGNYNNEPGKAKIHQLDLLREISEELKGA